MGLKRVPVPRDEEADVDGPATPGVADCLGAGAAVSWTEGVERTETASGTDADPSLSGAALAEAAVDAPRAEAPPLPALPALAPRAPLVPRGGIE